MIWLVLLLMGSAVADDYTNGILYPRASETRDISSLDGLWNFIKSPSNQSRLGFDKKWFKQSLSQIGETILMPVPSSYNDITVDPTLRDHVGLVWYDRTFFVSETWNTPDRRVWLRFSSVHYATQVWINGELTMVHEIGHLPFHKDVTKFLLFGQENRITVACDNMLRQDTIPQGSLAVVSTDQGKRTHQSYTFDFFNYAGIHRPVMLYTTPSIYIDDITILTDIEGDTGYVSYEINIGRTDNNTKDSSDNNIDLICNTRLLDKSGSPVATKKLPGCIKGSLTVPLAKFWWPYLMDVAPAYLYTLEVMLMQSDETIVDIYRQPVGIRTIKWDNDTLLINESPLYFRGFGRHEDSDIRGKGLDLPLIIRDYNLIKWIGANAYRTSHYPYAEEIMDLADQMGIMIIDECPSVNTVAYQDRLLQKHKNSLSELIRRDKNRPSVIMWSIANEARTQLVEANDYFKSVADHVRSLDATRPITMALSRGVGEDKTGQHLDIISFNRYNGWYSNAGYLDMITKKVMAEAADWRKKYNKPVLMSEYGADTMEGLHLFPEYIWSEEYQVTLMSKHFEAFDKLRRKNWFIGEFIWNFADFKTAQTTTRVGGNKKGLFTRNREPKASAFHMRRRYWKLANELNGVPLPEDLYPYDSETPIAHVEL